MNCKHGEADGEKWCEVKGFLSPYYTALTTQYTFAIRTSRCTRRTFGLLCHGSLLQGTILHLQAYQERWAKPNKFLAITLLRSSWDSSRPRERAILARLLLSNLSRPVCGQKLRAVDTSTIEVLLVVFAGWAILYCFATRQAVPQNKHGDKKKANRILGWEFLLANFYFCWADRSSKNNNFQVAILVATSFGRNEHSVSDPVLGGEFAKFTERMTEQLTWHGASKPSGPLPQDLRLLL